MKKTNCKKLFLAIIAMAMLTACSDNDNVEAKKEKKQVSFSCSVNDGQSLDIVGSRAITANGTALTDLAVFDYVDGVLQDVVKQVSTDATFGTPTLNLDFGEHRLVFVLSRGTDFSVDGSTCKWGKASDTFTKELNLTVTNSTKGQSVALQRVVSKLMLTIVDEIPSTVKYIRMTPSRFYNEYSTTGMVGVNPCTDARVSDISAQRGQAGKSVAWFTISPTTDEWNINATFTFLDADDKEIISHTKNSIPLLSNRTTVVSGRCFDTSSSMSMTVSVNDTWATDYNMDLY